MNFLTKMYEYIILAMSFTCFLGNSSAYLSQVTAKLTLELVPPLDYESDEYAACKQFIGMEMKVTASVATAPFANKVPQFFALNETLKIQLDCAIPPEFSWMDPDPLACVGLSDSASTVQYSIEIQGTTYQLTDYIGNFFVTYYDRRVPFASAVGKYDLKFDYWAAVNRYQLLIQLANFNPGLDFEIEKSQVVSFFGSENFTTNTSTKDYELLCSYFLGNPVLSCDGLQGEQFDECVVRLKRIVEQDFVVRYVYLEFQQNVSRYNITADASSTFQLWSRFFQNLTALEPQEKPRCYDNITFVNKGIGLGLQYKIPSSRDSCEDSYFLEGYSTIENQTMFLLHGAGYENTELLLKFNLENMGNYMDCSMTRDPPKCLDLLKHMKPDNLAGSNWAIALLENDTTNRIVKLRQDAKIATECANVGTLEVDTSVAVFTITDYQCSGAQRNQSARLIIRQGIEVLIVSSTNALYPNKTITFENITGLYDALQKSDNVYVQIADEVVAVQSFSTKLQIAFNPKVYITTGAVTAVITIITGVVFLFLV